MQQKLAPALGLGSLLLLLFASSGLAQDYRGRIEGIVTDQSQAVVVGATVTLQNVNTGVRVVRQTSDTGLYLFDLVDPGTYLLTVEMPGFGKFTQENIVVQTRGDVTVNATLKTGGVQESITVAETPADVQFNTSNQDLTIDQTMAAETPRYDRNPFKLTLLAPEAINTRGEVLPFLSWSANSVDLGGETNLKNDLQIDGSPVGMGHKFSYPPNMDDVQEVIVSQNSVDAESGHSAGGIITMTTKSGTNEWHGDAFYLGRYPWLNAESDRTLSPPATNATRQHIIGGTLGNPIKKNKLFNFFSIEYWKQSAPSNYIETLPTALETQGDFSKSYGLENGTPYLRTIYDPFSTVVQGTTVSRTPFPHNVVPPTSMDPLAASLIKDFWAPNNPGTDITGANNFQYGYTDAWKYYNIGDRGDWNVSDKWKVFGRYGRYHTTDIYSNPTPNKSPLYVPTGSLRNADQGAGDVIWTINPSTVVDFHGDYHDVVDAYVSPSLGSNGNDQFWPNNPWYQPYQVNSPGVPIYYPSLNIGGSVFGGRGFYWDQRPKGEAFNGKISHQHGSHYLKAGFEYRRSWGPVYVSNTTQFQFAANETANTYLSPDTSVYGDNYASFLLGALSPQGGPNGGTEVVGGGVPNPITNFYGIYFQDDWKVTRKLTVNLGLRDEYESAWHDSAHLLSQAMNLTAPITEMQSNPPQMPQEALDLVGGSSFYHYTGAWEFTTGGHPGMWDPPRLALAPRAGLAYALNDKTALRFGYARYVIPTEYNFTAAPISGFEDINFLEPPFFGMTGYQFIAPLANGVPQATLNNPFTSTNPLLPNFGPVAGKALGQYIGIGGENLLWYPQNFQKAYNDRFNFNVQRQLPGGFVASFTYFLNVGHQHYTKELNAVNPSILENNSPATLSAQVTNPFYHYLNTTVNNGPYYYQPTLPLQQLLVPYPQYGPLYEIGVCCTAERYNQLQVKGQKAFSKGFNFLFTYVYTRERSQINNFNDETYYNNAFQWQDSNQPRHRMNIAGTYDLPFGKGKTFLSDATRGLDAVVGGWKITPVFQYISGDFPQFGNMIVNGNPCLSNPTPGQWFNISVFSKVPSGAYTLRTNPLQYDCLTGPHFWDLDTSLAKDIHITERIRAELKMTAYNALNNLNRSDPDTNIYDSNFGRALFQGSPGGTFGSQGATAAFNTGRQVELGFKLIW
ncbi:MAG TPA: carboxypeptidase-like regulatory domain-containing protein [Bryobacteraceae bacterium]|nr:carboxypeptidase-like regulatory domain-containing protein [Bryobacteraceae bacterium]